MALALRRGFLLPFDDICNIGEVEVLSIYLNFAQTCDTGKIKKSVFSTFL